MLVWTCINPYNKSSIHCEWLEDTVEWAIPFLFDWRNSKNVSGCRTSIHTIDLPYVPPSIGKRPSIPQCLGYTLDLPQGPFSWYKSWFSGEGWILHPYGHV